MNKNNEISPVPYRSKKLTELAFAISIKQNKGEDVTELKKEYEKIKSMTEKEYTKYYLKRR